MKNKTERLIRGLLYVLLFMLLAILPSAGLIAFTSIAFIHALSSGINLVGIVWLLLGIGAFCIWILFIKIIPDAWKTVIKSFSKKGE